MSTWRSEVMINGTMVLPTDKARLYIVALGLGCNVEFFDMNEHSLVRPYRRYIQRIEEVERMLRFLVEEIDKLPNVKYEMKKIDRFLKECQSFTFDQLEDDIQKVYKEFKIFQGNNDKILAEKISAFEQLAVYETAARAMVDTSDNRSDQIVRHNLGFSSIGGIIVQEDIERFSRALFRMTRGNAFTTFESLTQQPSEVVPKPKSVFIVYFQGNKGSLVYSKIMNMIAAFGTTVYDMPDSKEYADMGIAELKTTLQSRQQAIEAYDEHFVKEIQFLIEQPNKESNSLIGDWVNFCKMEKATYAAIDMFEGGGDTIRCRVWIPAAEEDRVREVLRSIPSGSPNVSMMLVEGHFGATPPTYFRNTGFTLGFQNFVNTYGVPRYRETNPAVITTITLPFLFGIMYGDIGHGLFVLMTGVYLTTNYATLKDNDSDLVKMFLGGRYMILLMGIFATYSGLLYNDFLSVGLNIFGTRYNMDKVVGPNKAEWIPTINRSFPYPFGVDPVWKGAENELMFMNSFKMKFSVIIAGFHMGLGVLFKGLTAIGYRDFITLTHEFLPQMIFFMAFVGYLDFMIIYKWIFPGLAPNLITSLIEMAMLKKPAIQLYRGQYYVQVFLMFIIVITIPWMLLVKPLLLNRFHKRQEKIRKHAQSVQIISEMSQETEEKFEFGEAMIHQIIESIEFILGSISNTASYLRLWALSLAHQQLALVFFEQSIMNVFNMTNVSIVTQTICLFIAFAVFALITMGVMLGMDSLECFLHALRLQWVEFQSKFYKADGRQFRPFAYKALLEGLYDE